MRDKATIGRLEARKDTITFPRRNTNYAFLSFKDQLIDVLDANDLGRHWEWDEDAGKFFAEWSEIAGVGRFIGSFRLSVSLDPTKPIADEITRLQADREDFKRECSKAEWRARYTPEVAKATDGGGA